MLGRATRPLRAIHRATGIVGLDANDTARVELMEVYGALIEAVKVRRSLRWQPILILLLL